MNGRVRPSDWIALGLFAASLAMIAFSLASVFIPSEAPLPDRPSLAGFLAAGSVFVALPSVGAILAIRRSGNPIGWLFLVTGVGFIMGIFTTEYVNRATIAGMSLPGVVLVDWIGAWAGQVSITLAVVWIPLLFPDGHLPGPRWRPVAWAAAVLIVAGTVAQAIVPDASLGYGGRLANPVAVGGPIGGIASILVGLYFPVLAVLGLLSLASLFVRFRRSRDAERQQLKWFLYAVGSLMAAIVAAVATKTDLAWYAVQLGLASLPVAAGIAILRYRLYEIDRLVSRSIAYAAVTGALIVVYVAVNLALTTVFSSVTGSNSIAVAASTLVVAALFTPVRRRVQRVVDRRFDRARYDAERTTLAFSERLRDQVDLAAVTADLDDTIRASIAPARVGVWLRAGER